MRILSDDDETEVIAPKKKERKKLIHISTTGANSVISTIFESLKEIITRKKRITATNEIMKDVYMYNESTTKKHSAYTRGEQISFTVLALTILHTLILAAGYIFAVRSLKTRILSNNIIYLIIAMFGPFIAWLYATNENFWAFHKRKRMFFYLCAINLLLTILQPLYSLCQTLAVKIAVHIPVSPLSSPGMIVMTAQVIIMVVFAISLIIIYNQTEPLITNQSLKRQIEIFKFKHIQDNRADKDSKYDLHIVKNLEDGSAVVMKENDRFVQGEINGASGTGKTSSIFTTAIEEDLNTKLHNREKRQEAYLQLIRSGKATIKGPLAKFDESAVIAIGKNKSVLENNQKEIDKIKKRYPDAGITVIAPNASLNEDIIRLALAREVNVNVLDPVNDYSHFPNVRMVGINPFYIPFGLSENERLIHISQASTMFAEVLIATNQMSGEGDQYFTDISLSVCSNIATIIMLYKNIMGEQAYIDDIQEAINDFKKLNDYVNKLEEHYKIFVEGKGNEKGRILTGDDINKNKKETDNKKAKKNPYYLQILFVKQELLGAGAEDMFSQARGLRNLINKVILDPRIKTKLSAETETMLNFDELFSKNQVTIVNTAIELGSSTSTAFGLFFILLHKISVLRRPVDTRTPHFLWIDEATQYMHPCYEDMIALYRQFKCAVMISLQSLNQTEKSRATAYLKDVFLGAGTHIVFGRLTPEEMDLYSKMGGISRETEEQVTHTTSSVLATNPSYSESVRSTNTITNILEGSDMRLRDFQELTIFTIDNGRVLPGILGRVFFVKKEAFDMRDIRHIRWEQLVPEAFIQKKETEENTESTEDFKEIIKVTDEIPESETETLLSQREVNTSIEEKEKYDNMSLEELLGLLSGDESLEAADTNKKADAKTEDTPAKKEEISQEEKYKQMLNEFYHR